MSSLFSFMSWGLCIGSIWGRLAVPGQLILRWFIQPVDFSPRVFYRAGHKSPVGHWPCSSLRFASSQSDKAMHFICAFLHLRQMKEAMRRCQVIYYCRQAEPAARGAYKWKGAGCRGHEEYTNYGQSVFQSDGRGGCNSWPCDGGSWKSLPMTG